MVAARAKRRVGGYEAPTDETSRGPLGRGVAASASEPETARPTKREDKAPARQTHMSGQSAQPPQVKTDRKEYLKLKARERRAAERLGISVQEYRARQKAGLTNG